MVGFEATTAGTVPLWKPQCVMLWVACKMIPWGRAWVLPGDPCRSDKAWPKAMRASHVTTGAGREGRGRRVGELLESAQGRRCRRSMRLAMGGKGAASPSARKGIIFVSHFCCNRSPENGQLKITQICYCTDLEARGSLGLKSRCQQGCVPF